MTAQADFTPEQWTEITEAPPAAAMLVVVSQRGGMFRETLAIGKAYAEARQQHGASQLLDEVVGSKPKVDHTRYKSPEELREHALQHVRDAVAALRAKAQPQEVEDYSGFVVALCERVAAAHSEGGKDVSDAEREAIDAVRAALA